MVILVTGFLPFGEHARNPSGEIAERIHGRPAEGARIESVVLPVERDRAFPEALRAIDRVRPRAVVALGLGADRAVIGVERFARNLDDYRQGDEAGSRPQGEPVVSAGPPILRATLPEEELAQAIRDSGVPAVVSEDAGSFLCNHLYYRLLHLVSTSRGGAFEAVFLHLPPLPESVAGRCEVRASMAGETSERGVLAALRVVATRIVTV